MYQYSNSKKHIVAGILAHVDAGKTTLSESLLLETGIIKTAGRVDSKNAFLDNDMQEKERGITIYSKNARIPLKQKEMILIDTPGHVDFSAEMERALSILDMAILLISGPAGIQSHTKTLWSLLKTYRIPTVIFVNKMDMEAANKEQIINALASQLSNNVIAMNLTKEAMFSNSTLENIAATNENLLNEFLENENISIENISNAFFERSFFPVFFGSALRQDGINTFLEGLNLFIDNRNIQLSETTVSTEFSGIVYKINHDNNGKRLTFIKCTGGSLKVKELLGEEKVNELRIYSGEKYSSVQEVFPGNVFCIPGLKIGRAHV